jgi:hypothetical protein
MPVSSLPKAILNQFEVYEWRHATAILATDFPEEWADLCEILPTFRLCKSFITKKGGNKSEISKWFDRHLGKGKGWSEKQFDTSFSVDGNKIPSPTHAIDCFKNRVALEIEWNNKDPFFDRDLNNFRLLFELKVVSVGILITRSDALQKIFNKLGRGHSYGMSTTHMSKLLPKIEGGGAGGCPVLVLGIKDTLYDPNC